MASLPTIYTARSDVDAAHLARVEDWYARRHAPDPVRAGFYTAQAYYSEVGSPLVRRSASTVASLGERPSGDGRGARSEARA
jgi:hypothetical protein